MDLFSKRRAGVLLHPTSLPAPGHCGDFGADALRFIDLMASAGIHVWQVLPLGPANFDGSPYLSASACAGNIQLISLELLLEDQLLSRDQVAAGNLDATAKQRALHQAGARFFVEPPGTLHEAFAQFKQDNAFWLNDYVLFFALHDFYGQVPWQQWPQAVRQKQTDACDQMRAELADAIRQLEFEQFVFYRQWQSLRRYARQQGVALLGDMPIYVHLDSCDVWGNQGLFDLDETGQPRTVAGVPPDYFSEDGQRWGNPQYDWDAMQAGGFQWWLQRLAVLDQNFDAVRFDHFRGLEAFWEIAAEEQSAKCGRWVKAPGKALLRTLIDAYPDLCLIAENLGIITEEVEALRREFNIPGMAILQFAFDGSSDNPYLPHNHEERELVYTGTHDNDTTRGWFDSLDDHTRQAVYQYYGEPHEGMPWSLIRVAFASVANMVVVPMQDFLDLPGSCRMNQPGTQEGNWQWRFDWGQVPATLPAYISGLVNGYGRNNSID